MIMQFVDDVRELEGAVDDLLEFSDTIGLEPSSETVKAGEVSVEMLLLQSLVSRLRAAVSHTKHEPKRR